MIRIRKPKTQPAPLRKKGPAAHKRLCDFYAQPRSEPPVFEPAIYNAPAVRQALHKAQHGKCAYCEMQQQSTALPTEHFRPKGGVTTDVDYVTSPQGYWWLAWSWHNLFFACGTCNSPARKGNHFALAAALVRADSREIVRAWHRCLKTLFCPPTPFHALSYDVIEASVPEDARKRWRLALPRPGRR